MNLTLRDIQKMPPAIRDAVLVQIRLSPSPLPPVEKVAVPKDPYRSNLERDFAAHLDTGYSTRWLYEPVRLKIATGLKPAWYTPDFLAFRAEGEPWFYEVKGFWREAARVRIKVAAGLYPEFRFVAVTREKGEWKYEEFSRC